MARASIPTLLSLDRWAQIMNISPPHFNQAASAADGINPFPVTGCSDVWWQWSFQSHQRISREEIAQAIAIAEEDIANHLNFWPAPMYIEEVHKFPQHHRPDMYDAGLDVRGMRKGINLRYGKLIRSGRRGLTLIGDSTVPVYSDEDGDGYDETVTVTVAAGDLTDVCEIKVYFEDMSGDQTWEIRPHRTVALTGGNFVLTFWAWQFIDPDLWEAFPTNGATPLDLTTAIYVANVDVYREFADFTEPSAVFFWEPKVRNILPAFCSTCSGAGCPTCSLTTQNGCMFVRNVDEGIGAPVPATYDEDEEVWSEQTYTECRAPDQVKVWYLAGDLDRRYLSGNICNPLSNYWAETIAWLATARMERDFCTCKQAQALVHGLRRDLASTPPDGTFYSLSEDDLNNPFGTRSGEIKAWRRVARLVRRKAEVAVI